MIKNELNDFLFTSRNQFTKSRLSKKECAKNPFDQFSYWFKEALKLKVKEPYAMNLATSSIESIPSIRVVFLRELTTKGFIFYTNYNSRKAKEIISIPKVCLSFFWQEMERQIHIYGEASKLDEESSIKYFQSRPRNSQIGAWASMQSEEISNREELDKRVKEYSTKFEKKSIIEKPPHWGGYIVKPSAFEFWQGRENRIHDRIIYQKNSAEWELSRLMP